MFAPSSEKRRRRILPPFEQYLLHFPIIAAEGAAEAAERLKERRHHLPGRRGSAKAQIGERGLIDLDRLPVACVTVGNGRSAFARMPYAFEPVPARPTSASSFSSASESEGRRAADVLEIEPVDLQPLRAEELLDGALRKAENLFAVGRFRRERRSAAPFLLHALVHRVAVS
jgi:hypothetical protein